MKSLVLVALLVGTPLGVLAAYGYSEDGSVSIPAGILTGVGTGCGTAAYIWWRRRAWTEWGEEVSSRYEHEGVVHHGQARLGSSLASEVGVALVASPLLASRLIGAANGWLVLTKTHLVFEPRGILGAKPSRIALENVAGVTSGSGVLPTVLTLRFKNQQTLDIRVQKRDEWLDKLAGYDGLKVIRSK